MKVNGDGGVEIHPVQMFKMLFFRFSVNVKGKKRPIRYHVIIIKFLKEGEIFNENEIKNFCTNELSKYKIPDIVKKIDFIPRTGSGKTMRYKLIQNYEEKNI